MSNVYKLPDKIVEKITEYVSEHIDRNLSSLEERTKKLIDDSFETIIAKSLGFDNHWSKWEIDHCNNRRSLFTDHISSIAKEHAVFMANMFLVNDKGIFIDDKLFRELRDAAKDDFKKCVKAELQRLIFDHAHKTAIQIIDAMSQSVVDEAMTEFMTEFVEKNK